MPTLNYFLSTKVANFGEIEVSLSTLVYVLFLIVLAHFLNRISKKWLHKYLSSKSLHDSARLDSLFQIVSYIIFFLFTLLILNKLGINITVLLAGSTALMLGIGIGLQQNVQNFMAGITVLLDGTIKVGEIINYNNVTAKVVKVGLRVSVFETKEGVSIIAPNSKIVSEVIENVSYNNKPSLFFVEVGVDYSSNPVLVTKLLLKIAKSTYKILLNPKPFVRFSNFGESALVFQLFFSTTSFFEIENIKSILRYKIHSEFQKEGIKIPFPQRVVHVSKN
ncbi:mechanosensitive ion channel [bacterium]|nr:mechanosensitive ion channel [bacterium]